MKDISKFSVEGSPFFVYMDHPQVHFNKKNDAGFFVLCVPQHLEVALDDLDEEEITTKSCTAPGQVSIVFNLRQMTAIRHS